MDAECLIAAMERLHRDGFGDHDDSPYDEQGHSTEGRRDYTTDFAVVLEQFPRLISGLKYILWQGHNGGLLFGLTSGQIAAIRTEVYNEFREESPEIFGSST